MTENWMFFSIAAILIVAATVLGVTWILAWRNSFAECCEHCPGEDDVLDP